MTEYVYLLTSPERYKIGFSGSPQSRRSALRNQTKLDLTLFAMVPGGRDVEASAHKALDDYALGFEWFQPHEEVRRWFLEHLEFIDPGVPYRPNRAPQRLIDAGLEARTYPRCLGPAMAEFRAIHGSEPLDADGWCRVSFDRHGQRRFKSWRPPHVLPKMKEAVALYDWRHDFEIEVHKMEASDER